GGEQGGGGGGGVGGGGGRGVRGGPERSEHVAGRDRDAGIDQHGRKPRQRERLGQDLADAPHAARAGIEADRHVGAGRPRRLPDASVVERDAVGARPPAQRGGGTGAAAPHTAPHPLPLGK